MYSVECLLRARQRFTKRIQLTLVISIPLTVPTYKKVLFKHKFTPLGTHASTENLKKKKLGKSHTYAYIELALAGVLIDKKSLCEER